MGNNTKNKVLFICDYIKDDQLTNKLIETKNNKTLYTVEDYIMCIAFLNIYKKIGIKIKYMLNIPESDNQFTKKD